MKKLTYFNLLFLFFIAGCSGNDAASLSEPVSTFQGTVKESLTPSDKAIASFDNFAEKRVAVIKSFLKKPNL